MDRTGCETAPEKIPRGRRYRAGDLVVAVLVAPVLILSVALAVLVLAVMVPIVVMTVLIIALVVPIAITAATVVVVGPVVVGPVVSNVARADDRHVAVSVATRALDDNVAVLVLYLTLVYSPTVAVIADLIPPATVHLLIGAVHTLIGAVVDAANRAGAAATQNDVADAARALRIGAVLTTRSLIAARSLCA